MRDLKYIIKRILIGVGIVFVLGFINSAKASALTFDNMTLISDFRIRPNTEVYSLYYDSTNNKYCIDNPRGSDECVSNATDFPYIFCWNWKSINGSDFASAINGVASSDQVFCYFLNKPISYLYNSSTYKRYLGNDSSFNYKYIAVNYGNGTAVPNDSAITTSLNSTYNKYFIRESGGTSPRDFPRNGIILSNFDVYNFSDNSLYYGANLSFIPGVHAPEIESLQPTKITTNNIVTGYIFRPKFSSFDTELYDYQYKVGRNSTTWLGISQNEQQIRINNNTDFYVRIKEKSSGDIIDSRSMTLTNIGRQDSNVDYDIKFTGEYRTANDLNNNQSSMNSVIMEYQIAIDYIPKNSILKYQYQFITSGTCNDNNNWQDVPSSDNGTRTYVTNVNGTLCARILDPTDSDTQKKEATFVVNSIGKLAIDDNSNGVGGLFGDIASGINFGGPLSDIISIPINLINTISTGLAGGLTCNDYPLGSLWGTNLVIPCVNVKQHIGNSLYTTIDLIIACCMIYYIIKMFGELYTNLLFMSKNPIHDLGKRGD